MGILDSIPPTTRPKPTKRTAAASPAPAPVPTINSPERSGVGATSQQAALGGPRGDAWTPWDARTQGPALAASNKASQDAQMASLYSQAIGIQDQYMAGNADIMAAQDRADALAKNRNILQQAIYNQQDANTRASGNIDLREAGINMDINGIEQRYIPLYQALLEAGWGNAQGRYGDQMNYLNGQNAFAAGTLGSQLDDIGFKRDLLQTGYDKEREDLRRQRAVSGASSSGGALQDRLFADQAFEANKGRLGEEEYMANQKYMEAIAQNDYQGQMFGWDLKDKQLSIQEQEAKLAERNEILKKEAEKLGLQPAKILLGIQEKLLQSGLNKVMSTSQMMESLASGDLKRAQVVADALRAAGLDPRMVDILTKIAKAGR